MRIVVQIVVYKNDVMVIRRALQALLDSNLPNGTKLVVRIGDNSCENIYKKKLQKVLHDFSNGLRIEQVYSSVNLGHGQMHNKLFMMGSLEFDYLLLLNPDGAISPHAISVMVEAIQLKGVGAVEARQLPLEHPKMYNLLTGDTSWFSGACTLIRCDVYQELKGFDERFFLHGDDVDLSWRVRNIGFNIKYAPRAVFFHSKNIAMNGYPEMSESEKYYGPLGALLVAEKYGLKKALKLMLGNLKGSPDPIHKSVLKEFDLITKTFSPLSIKKNIPEYYHPWKFTKTRY